MKEHFWEAAKKLPLSAPPPFESTNEEGNHIYLNLFDDHPKVDGILITPSSILRMRVEKGELPWADLRFKSKTHLTNPLMCGARKYWHFLESTRS